MLHFFVDERKERALEEGEGERNEKKKKRKCIQCLQVGKLISLKGGCQDTLHLGMFQLSTPHGGCEKPSL